MTERAMTDTELQSAERWASGHGTDNGGWHVDALLREVRRLRAALAEQDDEPGDLPLPKPEHKPIRTRIVERRKRPDLVIDEPAWGGAEQERFCERVQMCKDCPHQTSATEEERYWASVTGEFGKLRQEAERLRVMLGRAHSLLSDIRPGVYGQSCGHREHADADPTYHCCDWREAADQIDPILTDPDGQAAAEELRQLRDVAEADWDEQMLRALTARGQRFDEEFAATWATAVKRHDAALAAWRKGQEGKP